MLYTQVSQTPANEECIIKIASPCKQKFQRPRLQVSRCISNYLLGYVFGHNGIEAVEEVGPGQVKGREEEEDLRPAAVGGESKVARLAVVGHHTLHVTGRLLP